MTLTEIHGILQEAYKALLGLYGKLPVEASTDTAFAIGEATGILSKAKGLVGRDIDATKPTPPGFR